MLLPKAIDEWRDLRFQDFKSISEYNSSLFHIKSKLLYCGHDLSDKDMIEKTLQTFHANSMILVQQYRERNFKKYHELLKTLLVAEQNNEILIKNHNRRPPGSIVFNEANVVESSKKIFSVAVEPIMDEVEVVDIMEQIIMNKTILEVAVVVMAEAVVVVVVVVVAMVMEGVILPQ